MKNLLRGPRFGFVLFAIGVVGAFSFSGRESDSETAIANSDAQIGPEQISNGGPDPLLDKAAAKSELTHDVQANANRIVSANTA